MLVCAALAHSALAQTPGAWKPARNVELVAASAAGGGSDNLARLIQKILQAVSQGITALIGGYVDVISTAASNLASHDSAGRSRISK